MDCRSFGLAWGCVVAVAAAAVAAPAYKGMTYTSFGSDVLSSSSSDQSLLNMSLVGTDTVALNFWWFQNSITSNSMAEDDTRYSSTISSVAHAIDTIHSLGMKVLLKPMIDIDDGTWRAYANPSDKDQWFSNYTNFLGTFADMAQSKNVELFSIGCEMNTLEQAANNQRWTNLISNMRSRYSGKLTYSANWGALAGNVGGYSNVPWWNQLDYIGIDAYFPIASTGNNNPTLAQLQTGWQNNATDIQTWRSNSGLTNKQVLFTEVGYQSTDTAAQTPYGVDNSNPQNQHPVDLQEQADAYNSLLSVMSTKPWWDGAFWWNWDTNPYAGGPADGNFTPQNKPANNVLASYYGGVATTNRGRPTTTLFSWETGLENWGIAGFNTSQPAAVAQSTQHATAGSHSLAVTQTGSGFSWDAGLQLTGDVMAALVGALKDGAAKYRLEFDVTYDTSVIPQSSVSFVSESVAINSSGGWSQVDLPGASGRTNQTVHVSQLLSNWTQIDPNSNYFYLYFGLNGNWGAGAATLYFDNLRLVNLSATLPGDYNQDGRVDAADYTIWRATMGSTTDLRADGNLNGVIDRGDYQTWSANYGTIAPGSGASSLAVPEPGSLGLSLLAVLVFPSVSRCRKLALVGDVASGHVRECPHALF
jgi:hypothetical protein